MSKLKIYVAGHKGMVGSGLVRLLKKNRNIELITIDNPVYDAQVKRVCRARGEAFYLSGN